MKKNLILAIPFIIIFISAILLFNSDDNKNIIKYETVKKSSFDLKLIQRGTLEASRFIQIKSQILSNRAKLVELIPEGTQVSKGVILARFDIKPFMDDLNKWMHKQKEAEAALIKAEKEVEIHKNKSIESIEKLKKSIEIEKINLQDIKHGSGLVDLNELKQKIEQESRKVKLSLNEIKDYDELYQQGYISKRERDEVENKLLNNQDSLLTAKEKLINYKKYNWPMQIKEHEIKLKELEEEIINKKIQNKFILDDKIAQLAKSKSVLLYYKNEIKKAKKNVEACDIRAPIDGIVIYNIIPKNGKKVKVDIGDSIWQNQSFMQIPDTKNMIVKTKIREVDLNKIYNNLKVKVTLDAYPSKVFNGEITYIDSIAKQNNKIVDIKFFDAIIKIKTSNELLRSGMSANIDIAYDQVKDSISIPNDAINYDGKSEFVEIYNDSDIEKRHIKIGKIGQKYSEVLSGLKIGESVVVK
ncbi:MAG: efflux RND transporter periplasmic adaptor subunit [Campylobacterota bacterium]|nr:efflux RND transporter periplasmic adaptor subunit [Campylobacterota bacterium]